MARGGRWASSEIQQVAAFDMVYCPHRSKRHRLLEPIRIVADMLSLRCLYGKQKVSPHSHMSMYGLHSKEPIFVSHHTYCMKCIACNDESQNKLLAICFEVVWVSLFVTRRSAIWTSKKLFMWTWTNCSHEQFVSRFVLHMKCYRFRWGLVYCGSVASPYQHF